MNSTKIYDRRLKMVRIDNQIMDQERALYASRGILVSNCRFEGPADGESALKESEDVEVADTVFALRYPLWHTKRFKLDSIRMNDTTRAPLWYAEDGKIIDSKILGVKAIRECRNITVEKSLIVSTEFGWKSSEITLKDTDITSEYLFLDSRDITLDNVRMAGKYSFQYVQDMTITNSVLNTKDAFWHTKNVTVMNSIVNGEYLGWYSEGLTLKDCKITGTQPLCYCKELRLINCTMEGTDLSFEYSDVDADITGSIDSVKNPRSGRIVADSVGEIIMDSNIVDCRGEVIIRK